MVLLHVLRLCFMYNKDTIVIYIYMVYINDTYICIYIYTDMFMYIHVYRCKKAISFAFAVWETWATRKLG